MRAKTYEEKALAGTVKLSKVRDSQLTTTQKPPKPQRYLTRNGKKIYKQICEHIIEHKILCEIDSYGISILAHNLDLYQRYIDIMETREAKKPGTGYIKMYSSGATAKSDESIIVDKAEEKIHKYAKEYGLTVKSRDGILAFSKQETDTEQDENELDLE